MKNAFYVVALALVACDSTGSLAQLARAPDVRACKPLGEAVIAVDATKSSDERLVALRQKAAQQGATHLVLEDGGKGQMYQCAEETEHDTRNDRRSGF